MLGGEFLVEVFVWESFGGKFVMENFWQKIWWKCIIDIFEPPAFQKYYFKSMPHLSTDRQPEVRSEF